MRCVTMPEATIGWLAADWPCPTGLIAGCTTRHGGFSEGVWQSNNLALHVGDDAATVQRNREGLQARLHAGAIQWLSQVHGTQVVRASSATASDAPEADAVWTDARGVALAIMTADCVPVVIADADGDVIGAAHAGWQGLRDGVLSRLLSAMPAPNDRLSAWLGPAISGRCYEVGEDVWSQFAAEHGDALSTHPDQADKRYLDLPAIARAQLLASGVRRVASSGWCSYADERFYSHRQAGHAGQATTGRMATLIMRR